MLLVTVCVDVLTPPLGDDPETVVRVGKEPGVLKARAAMTVRQHEVVNEIWEAVSCLS